MMKEPDKKIINPDLADAARPTVAEVVYGSNEIRLTGRQWLVAAVVVVLFLTLAPLCWEALEPFDPGPDYRVPNELSDDYWVYRRLIKRTMEQDKLLVVGDSVIWGEYVSPGQTLSQALNELDGAGRFVNGGVNATHPLALEGLLRYHAHRLTIAPVIVHCNLLWMSSPERDLQGEKEVIFNHPRLAPQFAPRIPVYRASTSNRLSAVLDRHLPFRLWIDHLRIESFESLDLHSWTTEHPYKNPLTKLSLQLPEPSHELRHEPIPWNERGIARQKLDWVKLETSLQWRSFQRTMELLKKRGNRLFVIIGPLNEHLMDDLSREQYLANKLAAEQYLQENGISHLSPTLLPSEEYGDASHPLNAGYQRLAKEIFADAAFRRWLIEH